MYALSFIVPYSSNTCAAIVLNQQFSGVVAPSVSTQFSHHLALLTSKADTQRRDSLNHISATITTCVKNNQVLPQPVRAIILKVMPLAQDISEGVRAQLLRFLQALPRRDVVEEIEDILRYLRLALTHLSITIRSSAVDIIEYVFTIGDEECVSCRGGWVGTLKCLLTIFGWNERKSRDGWTMHQSSKTTIDSKIMAKYLHLLATVMHAGLMRPERAPEHPQPWFPNYQVDRYMISQSSDPYGYLGLFGPPTNEDEQEYGQYEDRQEVFREKFLPLVRRGLEIARSEGGDIGRAAFKAYNVMNRGMADVGSYDELG